MSAYELRHPQLGEPVAVYPYRRASGDVAFVVCRFEPKDFRPAQLRGERWVWHMEGAPVLPYRLPELEQALRDGEPVWVVDGEKDAEALSGAGAVATCCARSQGWTAELAEQLTGARRIRIIADRDQNGTGSRQALQVRDLLIRAAAVASDEIQLLQAATGKDAADHLAAGRGLDEFEPLPLTAETAHHDGPVFVDLRDLQARDIEWVDRPFLPAGELVTNNADGDTGKGLLAVHWGARISRGEFGDRRFVLYCVAEDAYETVLIPRLLAAGANLEHVRGLDWRRAGTEDALRIPDDVPELEQHIAAMNVRLLVIDPLLSHFSSKTNTHVDHEVKVALRPLMALAQRTGCSVLGNGHFAKDKSGGARKAASGSTAFTNTPRVGLAMAYDDDDPDLRVLEVIKSNLGPKGIGRNYRVRAVAVDGLSEPVPMLTEEGAAVKAIDDLLAAQSRGKRVPSDLLQALLLAELDAGEQPRRHLDAIAAEKLGANPDTVYKYGLKPLKDAGRIRARKDGTTGGWYWRLTLEERLSGASEDGR